MALKMPYCGSKKYFQKVPTTAGASIIGSRIAVLQKLCERKRRLSSSASAKPSTSCSAIEAAQEVRGGAHVLPDRLVGQHAPVVVDAHPRDFGVGPVGAEIGERQPDRPQQREDVEGQQQRDGGADEEPGQRPVRQALAGRQRAGRRGAIGAWRTPPAGCEDCGGRRRCCGHCMNTRVSRGVQLLGAYLSLPSSLKTSVQSFTSASSAALGVPLPATT